MDSSLTEISLASRGGAQAKIYLNPPIFWISNFEIPLFDFPCFAQKILHALSATVAAHLEQFAAWLDLLLYNPKLPALSAGASLKPPLIIKPPAARPRIEIWNFEQKTTLCHPHIEIILIPTWTNFIEILICFEEFAFFSPFYTFQLQNSDKSTYVI